jgi:predicted Rossmann-fold nucleotide-binding protein
MVVPMLTNGAVADGALKHGGKVMVSFLFFCNPKNWHITTELILVDTMHERKTQNE